MGVRERGDHGCIIDGFRDFIDVEETDVEEFDYLMNELYEWGDISLDEKFGIVSATLAHTASPMGNNINVVEVFITHILIKADTSINPPTSLAPLFPIAINIFNARRLCNPDDSMPNAKIKPPINK